MTQGTRRRHRAKGRLAEQVALVYLLLHGFVPVSRNYRSSLGEIDLIVRQPARGLLVFVEVKFRTHAGYGGPAMAISTRQRERIRRTAAVFLQNHPRYRHNQIRFDAITFSGSFFRLTWLTSI